VPFANNQIPPGRIDPRDIGFPQISTGGFYNTFGDPTVFTTRDNQHVELFNNMTLDRGAHRLKFGAYYFHLQLRPEQPDNARGAFTPYEYNQHMRDVHNRLSSIDLSEPGGRFVIVSDERGNSHSKDDASSPGPTESETNLPQNVRNVFDETGEWALSSFDHRHQLIASFGLRLAF
jgi:hypothetical protein